MNPLFEWSIRLIHTFIPLSLIIYLRRNEKLFDYEKTKAAERWMIVAIVLKKYLAIVFVWLHKNDDQISYVSSKDNRYLID